MLAEGRDRAVSVTTTKIREYMARRVDTGAANGTVNRGLQSLRAAYNLLKKEDRLSRVPYFPHLSEQGNARKGFFERAEHEAIQAHLPEPHRDLAAFGYRTGWRLGEIGRAHA